MRLHLSRLAFRLARIDPTRSMAGAHAPFQALLDATCAVPTTTHLTLRLRHEREGDTSRFAAHLLATTIEPPPATEACALAEVVARLFEQPSSPWLLTPADPDTLPRMPDADVRFLRQRALEVLDEAGRPHTVPARFRHPGPGAWDRMIAAISSCEGILDLCLTLTPTVLTPQEQEALAAARDSLHLPATAPGERRIHATLADTVASFQTPIAALHLVVASDRPIAEAALGILAGSLTAPFDTINIRGPGSPPPHSSSEAAVSSIRHVTPRRSAPRSPRVARGSDQAIVASRTSSPRTRPASSCAGRSGRTEPCPVSPPVRPTRSPARTTTSSPSPTSRTTRLCTSASVAVGGGHGVVRERSAVGVAPRGYRPHARATRRLVGVAVGEGVPGHPGRSCRPLTEGSGEPSISSPLLFNRHHTRHAAQSLHDLLRRFPANIQLGRQSIGVTNQRAERVPDTITKRPLAQDASHLVQYSLGPVLGHRLQADQVVDVQTIDCNGSSILWGSAQDVFSVRPPGFRRLYECPVADASEYPYGCHTEQGLHPPSRRGGLLLTGGLLLSDSSGFVAPFAYSHPAAPPSFHFMHHCRGRYTL